MPYSTSRTAAPAPVHGNPNVRVAMAAILHDRFCSCAAWNGPPGFMQFIGAHPIEARQWLEHADAVLAAWANAAESEGRSPERVVRLSNEAMQIIMRYVPEGEEQAKLCYYLGSLAGSAL